MNNKNHATQRDQAEKWMGKAHVVGFETRGAREEAASLEKNHSLRMNQRTRRRSVDCFALWGLKDLFFALCPRLVGDGRSTLRSLQMK